LKVFTLISDQDSGRRPIGNVGPGFGKVGSVSNYADLQGLIKWILSFVMIFGRLEIFSIFMLFSIKSWK